MTNERNRMEYLCTRSDMGLITQEEDRELWGVCTDEQIKELENLDKELQKAEKKFKDLHTEIQSLRRPNTIEERSENSNRVDVLGIELRKAYEELGKVFEEYRDTANFIYGRY